MSKKKNYCEYNGEIVTIDKIKENIVTLEITENFTFDVFLDFCRVSKELKEGDKIRLLFIFDPKDDKYIEIIPEDNETLIQRSISASLQKSVFRG